MERAPSKSSRNWKYDAELLNANSEIRRLELSNRTLSDKLRQAQSANQQPRIMNRFYNDFEDLVIDMPVEEQQLLLRKHRESVNFALSHHRTALEREKEAAVCAALHDAGIKHTESLDAWKQYAEAQHTEAIAAFQRQADAQREEAVAAVRLEAETRHAEAIAAVEHEAKTKYEGVIKQDRADLCVRFRRKANKMRRAQAAAQRLASVTEPIATEPIDAMDIDTVDDQRAMEQKDADHQRSLQDMAAHYQQAIANMDARYQQCLAEAKLQQTTPQQTEQLQKAETTIRTLRQRIDETSASQEYQRTRHEEYRQSAETIKANHVQALSEIRQLKRERTQYEERIASLERALADQKDSLDAALSHGQVQSTEHEEALARTDELRQSLERTVAGIEGMCSGVEAHLQSQGREIAACHPPEQSESASASRAEGAIGRLENVLNALGTHYLQLLQDRQETPQDQDKKVVEEEEKGTQEGCCGCQNHVDPQELELAIQIQMFASVAELKEKVTSVSQAALADRADAKEQRRYHMCRLEEYSELADRMADDLEAVRERLYCFLADQLSTAAELDEFEAIVDDVMSVCKASRQACEQMIDDLEPFRKEFGRNPSGTSLQADDIDQLQVDLQNLLLMV
ncbi:uncharacterized protein N7459_001415 [Penicillium hispanicum]|uniref:uncharacterized protein n=1 Tax=Penicillium hispanicum TaxID=1080232 RepID=UPI00253F9454|nr:uncharacterized protein N7459_001415 [Penicillium hispanicum]KAJ5595207.1 hypothetical protein N7459_001415 [Penicillium hispanicum]